MDEPSRGKIILIKAHCASLIRKIFRPNKTPIFKSLRCETTVRERVKRENIKREGIGTFLQRNRKAVFILLLFL